MKSVVKDLSAFERGLWICSVIVVSAAFFFSPSGSVLSLVASLIGVTALIFVAKGYVLGQILTVVFAVFYGIVSWRFHYYGEMITYLCMTSPIAVMTVVAWLRHPFEDSREVRVNEMTKKQISFMLVLSVIVTIIFYFILKALGTANLLFSTISVMTSFLASYMTLMRSPYYAVGYAANDIVLIVLWTLAALDNISYAPMVMCFVAFLANDIYGFCNWRKMKKRQSE